MFTRLLGVALWTVATTAHAAPQVNVGVTPGVDWRPNSRVAFDGSVSADLMFARSGDATWGWGPRLELGTRAFDDLRVATGLSLQLPTDPIAVVGSAHGLIQTTPGGVEPGVGARLFIGLRPYNHYGVYSAALGLSLGADHAVAAGGTTVIAAVHVDAMWLSLPFLFLFNTATH